MDFISVVTTQRACRSFRSDPVDDATIEQLLTLAAHAPSAENRQPWRFVVVRDEAVRGAIGTTMTRIWEGGGRTYAAAHLAPALLADVEHGAQGGIAGAPVLVVVCADMTASHPKALGPSIYPAVQNLLLGANALGLGSAMTTLGLVDQREVRSLLGLPDDVEPMAIVPIGWPARSLGAPRRDPIAAKTRRDRWDVPW